MRNNQTPITGPYPGGLSIGPNSFPNTPAIQTAIAGKRANAVIKLSPQPLRADQYNNVVTSAIHKAKNKRVLVVILAAAVLIFHRQLLGGVK